MKKTSRGLEMSRGSRQGTSSEPINTAKAAAFASYKIQEILVTKKPFQDGNVIKAMFYKLYITNGIC
jgi:hypothetical protein